MRLAKSYNPAEYEADIYALWEKQGAFEPVKGEDDEHFSMVLPPPNANGDLHMGHALTIAIEDSLVRYHRMQGVPTLFVPGADHAGFETWVVYERKLNAEGKSRFDFTREELYKQVWDFVESNRHNFEAQLRALGGSLDWTRYTYTLDNKVIETAYETFQKLWQDGLVYRGNRIVNFCTFHGTSFSDIEVIHEQEKTKLWHIAYPLADGSGEVVIATTRPETKLGQSALMVNPSDKRFQNVIGKEVKQPLVPDQLIKIVADDHVEMDFGTGVVTVTPAHDANDFEVAQRHDLPLIELITPEGKMSDNVPAPFRGLSVMEAREAVVKALGKNGMMRNVEDYTHSIGKCYKCGTPIEPLIREQWFVKMKPLAAKAIELIEKSEINFFPASKKKQTLQYLQEIKDWNISRQIAWGIPIPAFQNIDDPDDWIYDNHVRQEIIEVDGKKYRRDPDVFDTWFSSGQWPYVTTNYPDGDEFKQFYPLSLMETGGEILHQWVARMIMLGVYRTGEVPFKDVYIHGYVLAEDGQKMSKSLGNVINPLELIGRYGSDALRMGLLTGRRAGINQGFHPPKVVAGRNFANKLWNVARFIEDKVDDQTSMRESHALNSRADHWIASRLNATLREVKSALEAYRLSEAYETIYQFVWHDLADWYVEVSKTETNQGLLAHLLDSTLKLAHPFAPFVTETIWQTLAWEEGTMLISQTWPQELAVDRIKAGEFDSLTQLISETRHIISSLRVKKPNLYYNDSTLLTDESEQIARLTGLGKVAQGHGSQLSGLKLSTPQFDCWLDIDSKTAKNYVDELNKKLVGHQDSIKRLESRLADKNYTAKAPAELVNQSKEQLLSEQTQLETIQEEINKYKELADK